MSKGNKEDIGREVVCDSMEALFKVEWEGGTIQ
jgi:hypothetical protein